MQLLYFHLHVVDNFDWYGYLTEDLDPLQTQFSDSSVGE